MCVVIKKEIDGVPFGPSISIPIKINTLEVAPVAEIPTAGAAAGLSQPEIEASVNLVRDWPTITSDVEKDNLLVCLPGDFLGLRNINVIRFRR